PVPASISFADALDGFLQVAARRGPDQPDAPPLPLVRRVLGLPGVSRRFGQFGVGGQSIRTSLCQGTKAGIESEGCQSDFAVHGRRTTGGPDKQPQLAVTSLTLEGLQHLV